MSATPLFSPTVREDQLQVAADLAQFRSDCLHDTLLLTGDIATIKADDPKQVTTLGPLVKQFHAEMAAMRTQLAEDRYAQFSAMAADQSAIYKELEQMIIDRRDPTALAANRSALLADRIKYQDDAIAGLNTRIATRTNAYNTLFTDAQAIVTAVDSDTGASSALQAAVTKWDTDKTTALNTMTADLAKIAADRSQLVTDLTALET
jgi:hypothetical protein